MKQVLQKMRGIIAGSFFVLLCSLSVSSASAQVNVVASAGTPAGTYPTLKDAFDAINAGTHQGIIGLSIVGDLTETATAVLNASGSGSSLYSAIGIAPQGGATRTISGSLAAPLIDFNGAQNVTIDGLNSGGNALVISNTSAAATAGTSTIRFANDASADVVTNCTILGASTGAPSQNGGAASAVTATVLFGGTTGTLGNDNITISNCTFSEAVTLPTVVIGSAGQSATASNDNISITGNNITNFYGATGANGIDIASNSSAWTITGNKFYQTASRTGLASANYLECIYVNTTSGGGYTINNNTIGYANGAGTGMLTGNGGRFVGIDLAAVAATPVSNIQGNTINGINWTTASGAITAGAAPFNAIIVKAGGANIGNTSGNTIGMTSGIGSATAGIYITSTTSGTGIFGVYSSTTAGGLIQNNTIGAIATSGTPAIGFTFVGIQVAGTGSYTVQNNIIGNSTAASIQLGQVGTTALSTATGIISSSTGTTTNIGGTAGTGNIIQNFNLISTSGTSAMVGILNSGAAGTLNASFNTIRGFAATTSSITGISNTAAVTTAITLNNNALGDATAGLVTYSVANSSALNGISNTSGTGTTNLSMQNNDFRGIVHSVGGSSAHTYLINTSATLSQNISGNTFTNLNVNTTGNVRFMSNDVALPSAASTVTASNNQIVTAFNKSGAGGTVFFYFTSTTPSSVVGSTKTYNNNNFSNVTLTGATTLSGWADLEGATGGGSTKNITNNTFASITGGTNALTLIQVNFSGNNTLIQNNILNNITGQAAITGIVIATSNGGALETVANNTITNISSTGTGGNVTGISTGANGILTLNVNNNTINTLSTSGASSQVLGIISSATNTTNIFSNTINGLTISGTTAPAVFGIATTGSAGTLNIFKNKIYGISATGAITNAALNGLALQGGVTVNAYNNVIGGFSAPLANTANAITGLQVNSTVASSTYRVYYNSVYVNATSTGTNFGTSALFHTVNATATTASLDLRNNIFINESVANGTGLTVAFRRSGTALNNYAATSNRNMFYSGVPSALNVILYDGTASQQTFANYLTYVSGRDLNSFTGEAPFTGTGYGTAGNFFISTTPSNANFLRPVVGITTQAESGATNITTPVITDDYAAVVRAGNVGYAGTGANPDLGAFEFEGITPAPVITLNSVTPPASTQCTASARMVSVNITTASGTITGANLVYAFNGTAQTPIAMTNPSGSTWTATIPAATPVNATVTWSVVATNSIPLNSTYNGTAYADEPLFGFTASASASSSTVCSGSPTNLSALLNNPSASTLYNTPSIVNPVTDEDIRTVRITQGASTLLNNTSTINTLNGTIGVPTGTAGSYSNYTGFAPTTLTGGQSYTLFVASIDAPSYFTNYGTAFIDFNRDGDFADAGESIIPSTGVLLNAAVDNGNDSISVSFTVPASAINGLTRMRVAVTETGQTNAAGALNNGYGEFEDYSIMITGATAGTTSNITSVTWMDGATTVGTGNPLIVNPTSTTTYSANITALGCVFSPAPTATVTVNPLPSAPTATNSAQCGTQVPTASVASTSALPTPTFVWYSAPTAGTIMQSSTSTTYTSNVATTTTFYVAELNTVTGCESARTAVTVTVAAADGILASVDNATICIGSSVNLTASNTNPTPNQSYSYTWTGTAGSGLASQAGAAIMVTPTTPGTYTYNLSGVDGLCNAVSSVNVTVNPFTSTVTPINITCNGYNNGSFSQGAVSCGSPTYTYSVDGGAFGPIPTNLTPGSHTVITMNGAGFTSASQNITITQPSTTIATPTGTNGTVCQNGTPANVSATSNTNTTSAQSVVVNFTVATQPTEVSASTTPATVAASPNVIATAVMAALPAGAVVTGGTLNYNNIQATGNSWMSDVRLGLTGPVTQNWTAGTGSANNAGTFNYVSTIPAGSINAAGGTISLHYFDFFNDNAGSEATFPTGAGVASITINYTMPVPATISWWDNASGGTQIGTGSPFNAIGTSVLPNTTTPGTYTLYAQGDFGGCSGLTRTAVTVTVNALPTVGAGTDQTVCSGTSVTLSGSGATSYTWNNGVTNNTAFSATATTTYTVTGTDANGCQNTDQVLVTVNALPTVNAGTDFAVCTGSPATLTGTGTATGYTWNNGVTNAVAFTPASTLTYTVTGTDGNGCQNTDAVVVTVNALPSVSAGSDQTVCSGSSVTLSGSGATSYTWDNGVTNGSAFSATATTTYTVTGTDGNGCQNTDAVLVTVNSLPTVDAGLDQTVCSGSSVTLSGSGATSYTWDNGVTDGSPFSATATTTYTVTGTDGNGCQNTDMVDVNVNALPTVDAGSDQTVCSGTSVTLAGSGATSYSWDNGVTDGVAFSATATTMYTVTGTDGNGCQNTDMVDVTVNALPMVDAGVDQISCSGSSVTLSGSGATSYTWDNGVVDGVAFTPASTATYTVTGTDANGCQNTDAVVVTVGTLPTVDAGSDQTVCFGSSVTLTGSGATTYTWDNGVSDGVAFPASTTTTYTVTGTDANGCQNTDQVDVTVNALPTVNAGVDRVSCVGSPVTLTGSGTATGYTWDNGVVDGVAFAATVTTTYTVTGTDANGCSNTDQVVVNVNSLPTATATDNGDATITASAGAAYQWIDCSTGNPIVGATAQTLAPTVNGSYAVIVENASGCSDTSSCVLIDYIGISENSDANIAVFPNPTHNDVTITMSASSAKVTVVDAQGKLLQVVEVANSGKVDLSTYETGVYFLRIQTENGSTLERIVKN